MNTLKKLLMTLLTSLLTTSIIYAQPCIGDNCHASIGQVEQTLDKQKIKVFAEKEQFRSEDIEIISLEDNTDMIELVDNASYYSDNQIQNTTEAISSENIDEESIVAYDNDDVIEDITLTYDIESLELAKVYYACEDIANNIVACDNKKTEECECV